MSEQVPSIVPAQKRAAAVVPSSREVSRIAAPPETVIRPTRGWASLRLGELVEYRDLLFFLVWRDIKVRYKQTALGAAWAIIQPTATMIVFTLFFGKLAKIPSDGVPYPVFAYCGLLPWQLFAYSLTESSNSLVAGKNLITKVYFPRLLVPLSSVLGGLADFAIAFVLLAAMMIWFHVGVSWRLLLLPFFIVLAIATALAMGTWLSALNVRFRDVRYVIPFLTQFWMFATPVAYPTSFLPEKWRTLYGLNPMAGVVEGFRWCLIGSNSQPGLTLLVSTAVVLFTLVGGLFYFRRTEATFADVL